MTEMKKHIESLIEKAASVEDGKSAMLAPDAAMKYSQAALNAANALCSLKEALRE